MAALLVLLAGGGLTFALWRRQPPSRPQVGGAAAATLVMASGVIVLPAVLAAPAPPPVSSVTVRTVSAVTDIPAGQTATVSSPCPAGSVLVGGGARTNARTGDAALSTSRPDGAGWLVTASASPTEAIRATAVAICTTDVGADSEVVTSDPLSLDVDQVGRVDPRCPAGGPMAVGWDAGDGRPVVALPLAQGAAVTSWADAKVTSTQASLLCSTRTTTAAVVRTEGDASLVDPGAAAEAFANCPTEHVAVSGGFVAAASVGGRVADLHVSTAAPAGDRFVVRGAAPTGSGGIQLTVFALCLPRS